MIEKMMLLAGVLAICAAIGLAVWIHRTPPATVQTAEARALAALHSLFGKALDHLAASMPAPAAVAPAPPTQVGGLAVATDTGQIVSDGTGATAAIPPEVVPLTPPGTPPYVLRVDSPA